MEKKKTPYFSHDANAREDPKISAMRSVYGWEGYGWYWLFIENMREQQDYKLSLQGQYVFDGFAMKMHCTKEVAEKFINDCIFEFKLFKSNSKMFWSNSLMLRMEEMESKSKKASNAAKVRWGKGSNDCTSNAEVMQAHSDSTASEIQTHSESNADVMQIKEKKRKEIKVDSNKYTSEFDSFWDAYPEAGYQNSKPQAFKNFTSLIKKKISVDSLIQAAANYAADCKAEKKTDYLYKASNFVGRSEYYKSYLPGIWVPVKPKQSQSTQPEEKLTVAEKAEGAAQRYALRHGVQASNVGTRSMLLAQD